LKPEISNLLRDLPPLAGEEIFEILLSCQNLKIERISSPANTRSELFIQEQDEWVALLQGEAEMRVDHSTVHLQAGDFLSIPAQTPHQVLTTSSEPLCVWLAIHLFPAGLDRRQSNQPS